MTVEELKKRKVELWLTNEALAALSGVPLGTVQKIMGGATRTPRLETMVALEKVLFSDKFREKNPPVFNETAPYYVMKTQGEYTLEDYLRLPDDRRVELIDGVFYDMSAPTVIHQQIVLGILAQLDSEMRNCPHGCFLFVAPTDVQLDRDQKTIVQPDVMIVCDREKITAPRIFGAPDFVVEVTSPKTKERDMFLKARKYQAAGVREYWVVDPKAKQIYQYGFSKDVSQVRFLSFEDKVPVLISEGQCFVDFAVISERLAPFYELEKEEDNGEKD